jgi:hypothetical protein
VIDSAWGNLARQLPGLRKTSSPKISHAYAGTAHSAQGRTAAAAVLYVGRKTDAREIYVGLTRHKQEAHVVVEAERLDAACRQRQEDSRLMPTRTAIMERLFAEAGQYRAKSNVVDYVRDRAGFIATGSIELHEPEQRWSLRRVLTELTRFSELANSFRNIWSTLARHAQQEPTAQRRLPEHLDLLRQRARQRENGPTRERSGPTLDA